MHSHTSSRFAGIYHPTLSAFIAAVPRKTAVNLSRNTVGMRLTPAAPSNPLLAEADRRARRPQALLSRVGEKRKSETQDGRHGEEGGSQKRCLP